MKVDSAKRDIMFMDGKNLKNKLRKELQKYLRNSQEADKKVRQNKL